MAYEDMRPSRILSRESFPNAIRVVTAIGGSSNAQPHIHAMAQHAGIPITAADWSTRGYDLPLLVDVQPAGRYLGEAFHRAGGVPAVMAELLAAGKLDGACLTVTVTGRTARARDVIRPFDQPLKEQAGFPVLSGNLFDVAIMKTSVISPAFRERYLCTPGAEGRFDARAIVFEGSDDHHHRINDPALDMDEGCILVIRGAGPIGWPGSAAVVNMQPPDHLIQRGIMALPTLGDGRQSGTSDSPSILNASPESAVGGGLSWLRTGDRIRFRSYRANFTRLILHSGDGLAFMERIGSDVGRIARHRWRSSVWAHAVGHGDTGRRPCHAPCTTEGGAKRRVPAVFLLHTQESAMPSSAAWRMRGRLLSRIAGSEGK